MSNRVARSLWISAATFALLAVLLGLSSLRLGGRVPALKPLSSATNAVTGEWLTFQAVGHWFEAAELTRLTGQTNTPNPFFTRHFQPPPPPSTKAVELTYLGFYASADNLRRAFIQVDNAARVFTNGAVVVADHVVREIARRTLVLTNAGGRTNVLEFRIKKVLEIPAK